MKRKPSRELLDDDAGSPQEVAESLADLRFVNRWFGGVSTTHSLLRRAISRQNSTRVSMLEVAAGSADVALQNQQVFENNGIQISVTALDRSASHLPSGVPRVVANALALPFHDDAFDLVGCALFAHHLSPQDFSRFASEALRVAKVAVLINDLIRHPMHLALIYAGMPLYRSPITRHDAVASVKQAYTMEEMCTMLTNSGASRVEMSRHYLFRMGAIAWKRA
jgi:ubiquinone/menaquinone biosynthesis C-methylase UbiE